MSEPHGIIVTPTLHLTIYWPKTACSDFRVDKIVDGLRRRAAEERDYTVPIGGYADGRPVCRRCIAAYHRLIEDLSIDVIEAEEHNAALGGEG